MSEETPKHKPSDEAIEWVGCNLSHEAFLEDWIMAGCQSFDAGKSYVAREIETFIEVGAETIEMADILNFIERFK